MLQAILLFFLQVRFNVIPDDSRKGSRTRRTVLIECEGKGRVNEDVGPPDDERIERVETTA